MAVTLPFTHKFGEAYTHPGIFPEALALPGRLYRACPRGNPATAPLVTEDGGKGKPQTEERAWKRLPLRRPLGVGGVRRYNFLLGLIIRCYGVS